MFSFIEEGIAYGNTYKNAILQVNVLRADR